MYPDRTRCRSSTKTNRPPLAELKRPELALVFAPRHR